MMNVLHKAFISQYRGKAADAFGEYLARNDKKFCDRTARGPLKYYGKFSSIVQGCGTGKSRQLFELRTKGVLILYTNIRPSDDITGFLARDDVPAAVLVESDDVDYGDRCRIFFAAIFDVVCEYASARLASGSSKDAVLEEWDGSICDLRLAF